MKAKVENQFLMFAILLLACALGAPPAYATPEQDSVDALTALENHILGTPVLTGPEIAAHKATIDTNQSLFASSSSVMAAGLSLVETYDTQIGPLWVQGSPVQTIDRNTITDSDIEWSIWNVMQYLMDYTYTVSNVATYETTLDGKMFGSSAHFPGYVDPAAQRTTGYSIDINADYPDTVGWTRFHEGPGYFSRRPTGTYAAPGDIVTVTVPSSMVNQGYRIRVGCHSWDFGSGSPGTPKNPVRRLDRVSLVYDITSATTKVANPLGGGIYIEVPFDTAGNVETVQITNAVRSPFFSVNSITGNNTTIADWINIERNNPAPWADFQSEKFMMNVPTDWIYALDTPDVLMADWDLASDIYNDLMGFPYIQGRENFYMQVDLTIRGNAYYPGWPQCNVTYNPNTNYGGLAGNFLVNGPQYAPSHIFHEEGHGYLFPKFPGETESSVNIGHAAIWHQGFGYDLDYAFAASRGEQNNPFKTLDNTAICWMLCLNFVNEVPMAQAEKQYQLKGHAKYINIARMFGWQVVNDYFKSFVDYYEATGITKPFNNDTDEHILRLCIAADCDLRPLLYFWGIHPANPSTLAADIAAANLTDSTADRNIIYDQIDDFSKLVPGNNAQFQSFCLNWWGGQPSVDGYQTEREHAQQWDTYDESSHDAIVAVITNTLATYFPGGDPIPDTTAPTPDPMTWASLPTPGFDATSIHEMENGVISGARIASGNAGYTGTGFVDYLNSSGDYVELTVNVPVAGDYDISYRYALQGGDRPLEIKVNGQVVDPSLSFPATGSWTTWGYTATIPVTLNAGDNTITATAIGSSGANVDHLLLEGFVEPETTISMTATTATDESGVEYYFTETSGNPGGSDSGWQDSPVYTDTGLLPGTQYTYTVTARDLSPAQNETVASAPASATTTGTDTTPPTPDPATFAIAPSADSDTAISMTASTGTDASGPVEYLFTETSGNPGGSSSGWQTSPSYTDSGLDPDTQYTYTVTMRDALGNTGTASSPASATTQGGATIVDNFANGETTISGTVSGFYSDTAASDNTYESITEIESGGKPSKRHSLLEHTWTINIGSGGNPVLYVEAYHNTNSEGDDFTFAYSTDNVNFTDVIIVPKTADDDTPQNAALPSGLTGTVYIRVVDTDSSQGNNSLDTVYVDQLYIQTTTGGGGNTPPAFTSDPIVEINATENAAYSSTISDDATDPDPDTLTYTKLGGPAWLIVASNGDLSGTPTSGDLGLNSFTVQVDDGNGGTDQATLEITVDPVGGALDMYVFDIAMTSGAYGGNRYSGIATITIKDQLGSTVTDATVNVDWTGATTESMSNVTNGSGQVVIESKKVKNGGTFTVTVTGVNASGYNYNDTLNIETFDSVTAP